jgi:hypothetical protein
MKKQKSQSQRLRNVLFLIYEESANKEKYPEFLDFYNNYMNKVIEKLKEKISNN